MRILWVEDEQITLQQKNYFFTDFSVQVKCISDFTTALKELETKLYYYDLLILDIDLRHSPQDKCLTSYLEANNEYWKLTPQELLHEAGFHLYLKAFHQHFPVNAIAFFTGNVSHDENSKLFHEFINVLKDEKATKEEKQEKVKAFTKRLENATDKKSFETVLSEVAKTKNFEQLREWYTESFGTPPADDTGERFIEYFKSARIPLPKVFNKKEPNIQTELTQWLQTTCTENNPQFAYITLRRGILDILEDLESKSQFKAHYEPIIDKNTFLEGIAWLLKPHHSCPNNPEETVYLTVCDQLSKPFDKFGNESNILKPPPYLNYMRNWISHGNIRLGNDKIKPETVALLFLLALETLFENDIYDNKKLFDDLLKEEIGNNKSLLKEKDISDYNAIVCRKSTDKTQLTQIAQINLIELFYASCLDKLPSEHLLYSALQTAYQKEPKTQLTNVAK